MPRLGKLEYVHDPRTLKIGLVLAPPPTLKIPLVWDFDKGRAKFPVSSWGNDQWGNCVIAGRTNHMLRQERVERRSTPIITPAEVVEEYKAECYRQFGDSPQQAGDQNDNGLYVIEAIKDWRNSGWPVKMTAKAKRPTNQSVAAYGEISGDSSEIRAAIYLLNGIQMGLSLPRTAGRQWARGEAWSVAEGNDPDTQPGSWGGHLVYCKHFDEGGVFCLTWGREVYMTNGFINRYCDERWAVVDALDTPRASRWLDVEKMLKHLRDVGASGIT